MREADEKQKQQMNDVPLNGEEKIRTNEETK